MNGSSGNSLYCTSENEVSKDTKTLIFGPDNQYCLSLEGAVFCSLSQGMAFFLPLDKVLSVTLENTYIELQSCQQQNVTPSENEQL